MLVKFVRTTMTLINTTYKLVFQAHYVNVFCEVPIGET